MTAPEPSSPQPRTPFESSDARNIWIVLSLYIAGAVAISLLNRYPVAWDRGRGSFILLGPYGLLTDAVSTNPGNIAFPFLVVSVIFLGLLLAAVVMRSGWKFWAGIAASIFWLFCGFIVDVVVHFTL
jgi:hypothetical protein